jgi:DNA-binding CsgD family transcriptional regulator
MATEVSEEQLRDYVARFTALPATYRELVSYTRVTELLARAADAACQQCGFDRCVVLAIGDGELTAADTEALAKPASDKLRRQALSQPIRLTRGTAEAALIRRAGGDTRARPGGASVVQAALGLEHHAVSVIAPESRALALLVLDRARPPVGQLDQALVDAFASMLAVVLEHAVLHARVSELSLQLRDMTVSTQALMAEMLEAPMTLPMDGRYAPGFPLFDASRGGAAGSPLRELLSERELAIAALIAEGRSNREIAAQLIVSPETVKAHVARILRKLNASNRAEAVSRYLRLAGSSAEGRNSY